MSAHPQDELLAASLDGSLPEPEREALDAHLEVCAHCRGELEVARTSRDALRALPAEVRPPIDVAAAVAASLAGDRPVRDTAPAGSGPPRWYRAAGLVAAAAAIVLAVMVLPDLGGRDAAENATRVAADAGAEGSSETNGAFASGAQGVERGVEALGDLDQAEVQRLADQAAGASASIGAPSDMGSAEALAAMTRAADCVRSAAGSALPTEVAPARTIAATYLGTPAFVIVAPLPDGRVGVWVAARGDCRLLASAFAPS